VSSLMKQGNYLVPTPRAVPRSVNEYVGAHRISFLELSATPVLFHVPFKPAAV
jgi:hypothetical protein